MVHRLTLIVFGLTVALVPEGLAGRAAAEGSAGVRHTSGGRGALQTGASRDRSYWLAIVENDYALPEGADAFDLLLEMNPLLGSNDPMLRDRVAYGAAARWIYRERRLKPDQLRRLLSVWTANLESHSGPLESDGVLLRSFSALNLSLLAALDNVAPFMTQADFERLLGDGRAYLVKERDSRGFEPGVGWIHATAHAADLLKFLARSPRLPVAAQARILDTLSQACLRTEGVFVWAEDERLAQVLRSLVRRPDVDAESMRTWLEGFVPQHRKLWAAAPAIDPERFVDLQNVKLVLRAAYVALAADADLKETGLSLRSAIVDTLTRMQ